VQWYLLFNIIGAVKSIPGTILEASRAFGLKGLQFYITIVLPAIFPGILLGTIQAWGGAWNSLIVSEYISYSGVIYSVPGLGAMLSEETSSPHPDPWVITLVVACMSFIVLFVNHFLWQPLFQYAEKFRVENV
jgi:NitT/TauT family transport system permease protein